MRYPLWKGYITQVFKTTHLGVDKGWLRLGITKPKVGAWADGVCVQSTYSQNYGGNGIALIHRNISKYHDYVSRYWHLDSRALKVGDVVKEGDGIGIGGNTGLNSTGDHLHFEVWIVPKGYHFLATDRPRFAIDTQLVTFIEKGQPFTGAGVQTMSLDYSKLPLAKPTGTLVRMRSTPAILPNNVIAGADGKPIFVPQEGIRFVGVINEIINNHRWVECRYGQEKVFVAFNLLKIEDNVQIVEVEKIVEKVKPINETFIKDGVEIKLQVNEVLK